MKAVGHRWESPERLRSSRLSATRGAAARLSHVRLRPERRLRPDVGASPCQSTHASLSSADGYTAVARISRPRPPTISPLDWRCIPSLGRSMARGSTALPCVQRTSLALERIESRNRVDGAEWIEPFELWLRVWLPGWLEVATARRPVRDRVRAAAGGGHGVDVLEAGAGHRESDPATVGRPCRSLL